MGLIGAAMWDGLLTPPPPPKEEIVRSSVDILSEAEFQARFSSAPDFVPTDAIELGLPVELVQDATASDAQELVEVTDVDGPADPPAREGNPDLSAARTQNRVRVQSQTAQLAPQVPQSPTLGLSRPIAPLSQPRAPSMNRPSRAWPTPQRPSLNIDTRPSAPPPPETREAETDQVEIAEGDTPSETETAQEAQEATARREAASEIVPLAPEDAPEETVAEAVEAVDEAAEESEWVAPQASLAPPRRLEPDAPETPEDEPAADTEIASVEPEQTVEPPVEETPHDPNLDSNGFPIGQPLTVGERENLRGAIAQYWNTSVLDGLPNSDNLVVTVGVTLNEDGSIVDNEVRPIEPANPQGAYLRAFQAAQRAVLQAGFRGAIDMPADKYAQWRELEITFNPGTQQVGF